MYHSVLAPSLADSAYRRSSSGHCWSCWICFVQLIFLFVGKTCNNAPVEFQLVIAPNKIIRAGHGSWRRKRHDSFLMLQNGVAHEIGSDYLR